MPFVHGRWCLIYVNLIMRAFVHDRWFPFIEITLIFLAGIGWFIGADRLTIEPIFIALIPWGMRIGAGEFPFRRTRLDWFVLLFVVTAAISITFAYDSQLASIKFFILFTAVLLFYALAGMARSDIWWLATGMGLVSVATGGYFWMTNDWVFLPADVDLINRIGLRWMQFRPNLPIPPLHANAAGGIVAMLLPFQIALIIYSLRAGHQILKWLSLGIAFISLVGLVFTSSRGAWGALLIAGLVYAAWKMSVLIAGKLQKAPTLIFLILSGVSVVVGVVTLVLMFDRIMGSQTLSSRLLLDKAALDLIFDYPFGGAGLAAFGGQYSQYIFVVPVFQFNYGHFFWFDVVFEQGVLGLIAWIGIYAGAFWMLFQTSNEEIVSFLNDRNRKKNKKSVDFQSLEIGLFRWAILLSLVTMLAHSFIDDTLYAFLGMPMLFMLPGLCLLLAKEHSAAKPFELNKFVRSRVFVGGVAAVVVLLVTAVIFRNPLLANWYAMQGAVEMAKIELEWWPTEQWDTGENVEALIPASDLFEKALSYDADNRTANHRLGLIAMLNRDYETAVSYLGTAYQTDPDHRGIIKNLGYSYVWLGEYETAAPLLDLIDESDQELDEYSRWWGQQGRSDLAYRAATMIQLQS